MIINVFFHCFALFIIFPSLLNLLICLTVFLHLHHFRITFWMYERALFVHRSVDQDNSLESQQLHNVMRRESSESTSSPFNGRPQPSLFSQMGSGRQGNGFHENSRKERMISGVSATPLRGAYGYNESNLAGGDSNSKSKLQQRDGSNDPYMAQQRQQLRMGGNLYNSGSMASEAVRDTTIGSGA